MGVVYSKGGKAGLDAKLPGYNLAAQRAPWLVVRDFDMDASCPAKLREILLPAPARHMRFRIAVRAVEAWLLADREALSRYLRLAPHLVPSSPDEDADPKRRLIAIASYSRSKDVREDMVPISGSSAVVGPGYLGRITEFASKHWRPEIAEKSSDSLRRCRKCLREWTALLW
jgi:hypothetical protein